MRKIATQIKGLALLLFFICLAALGQSQTVSGTVKDPDKKVPISGATIKVVGTTLVTQTNDKGVFTIKATAGQILTISSIGFESQKVVVKAGESIVVDLKSQSVDLEEVTVAMDIKRNPKELGYSAQKLAGAEIKETQRDNFITSLQGRIAGVTVTSTSGVPGASASIVLRGFNSLSLNNQPLFVIDGILVDNSTVDATANIAGPSQSNTANDFSNRIADINPNDIESVTILKGPEATVLYGSSASNGAIVITTKRAKLARGKALNIFYDNSFRFQALQKLPPTFDGYYGGTNGVNNPNTISSFGMPYLPGTVLYDNIGNFFRTSFGQTHNLATEFGTAKSNFRFTASYYDQNGVVPNTRLVKSNFKITNTTKIGKYLDVTPSIAYTNSTNNKALRGAGGYLLNLLLWPSTDNAADYLLPNDHKRYLIAANNPAPGAPLGASSETDNPFFAANRNSSVDKQNRYIASLGINFNPYPWLTVSGRFGYDHYFTTGYQYRDPESASQSSFANKGSLDNYYTRYSGYNHTITASARKKLDKFNFRLTLGTRWNQTQTERYGVSGTFDSTRSFDSSSTGIVTRTRLSRATLYPGNEWNVYRADQIAGFTELSINYNNVIFLTGSLAFESSSVLPAANRNYSYPGGSLSIILSDIFPKLKGGVLNYWKLRTSLASTARLPDAYTNQSFFVPTITSFNPYTPPPGGLNAVPLQYGFTNANPNLKPERQKTYEIGTEAKLFNNSVSIDAAYYNTLNTDQIAQGFRASYGSGFVLNTRNNSSVRNQGIEITLGITPIKTKDFDWNIQFNFNHTWNKVLAIPPAIDIAGADYYDASTFSIFGNIRGGLRPGYSTGTITSFGYKRQDLNGTAINGVTSNNGAILISPTTGLPIIDGFFRIRGDRTPWITLGTINKFRYKNFGLSFLWDLRVGGDIWNGTNQYLTTLGKSSKTIDRLTPRVIQGVLQNGLENTANPTINTIAVTPYYNSSYYTTLPEEEFIEHDIKAFRLRDISFTYTLPSTVLKKSNSKFTSLGLFITCNDLLLFTNYSGADPESNGGNASLKGVGATGFDYGNTATPLSFNFGLRAGF